MERLIVISFAVMIFAACKKEDNVSTVYDATYPTITFSGSSFYSITTGSSLPEIQATAYDSVLGESYPVEIVGTDALDNTTPGLYIIQAKATNKYGFYTLENVLVAVTDVSEDVHLEGLYERVGNNEPVHVTRLARGLYETDDVGGAATAEVAAYFVHINDTLIDLPAQTTSAGVIEGAEEKLTMVPGDTSFQYRFSKGGNAFNTTATRIFVKQ